MRPLTALLRPLPHTPAYVWAALLLTVVLLGLARLTQIQGLDHSVRIDQAVVQVLEEGAQAQVVALPHEWDRAQRRWAGQAQYTIRLPDAVQPLAQREPGLGLLLPRAGVRYRVLLNGHEVAAEGWRRGPGYFDAGPHAHFVNLPAHLMRSRWDDNRVDIQIQGQALRISGLSAVWVGPAPELSARRSWLYWWQVHLTWMVAASAFLLGLLSALIWLRTGERQFGLLGGGLLVLTVRLWLSAPVYLPGPFLFWDYLHKLSFTLYCGFIYLFMSELFNFQQGPVRRLVNVMMLMGPVWLAAQAWVQNYELYRLWTGVIVLVCVLSLGMVIHRARWGMDRDQRLMVVVGLATMVTGLRDYLVVQLGWPGDVDIRWMTPGSLFLMFTMGWVLLQRTTQSLEQVGRLNAQLAQKVSEREAALQAVFDRLRQVENQRVLEAERRRLTRDMHDGLGSQLVQTLNLVRSAGERVDSTAVASMLSHALEELRMTLDSLEPMDGDLPTILGTLRQRMAPALQAARIELDWQVEEVPPVPGLEARGVMHLFRCLQEVLANVVKHAHATRVTVRTWAEDDGICLSVCDNGIGPGENPEQPFREGGRGISNIRLRATELGAQVRISAARPGTCVLFRFPLSGL